MRHCLTLATVLALAGGGVGAEPLVPKRGINGDLWNNWGGIAAPDTCRALGLPCGN